MMTTAATSQLSAIVKLKLGGKNPIEKIEMIVTMRDLLTSRRAMVFTRIVNDAVVLAPINIGAATKVRNQVFDVDKMSVEVTQPYVTQCQLVIPCSAVARLSCTPNFAIPSVTALK